MRATQNFGRRSEGCPPGSRSMRRLAEGPANLLFFGRSILTKS